MPSFLRLTGLSALATLAACAAPPEGSEDIAGRADQSSLFQQLATRVLAVSRSMPASLVLSERNVASPDVLIGGAAIFDAVGDLIASAEHDAELQTWRWDPGCDVATRVLRGLQRLETRRRAAGAQDPVVVRLLVNRVVQPADLLRQISVDVAALALDSRLVDVQLVDYLTVGLASNHAKTVTIDGQRALVTGANVATGYGGTGPEWWDAAFLVTGEVVGAIHSDFAATWTKGRRWLCGTTRAPSFDDQPIDLCWDRPSPATTLAPSSSLAAKPETPMLVATHAGDGLPFPRARSDNPQAQLFLGALESAQHRVRLQSPNLNEDAIKRAIIGAARRGVHVELLLSKGFEEVGESLPGRGGGNELTVDELAAQLAGELAVCNRLEVRWYSADGKRPVEGTPPPASHVKYLSVDGEVAIIGSANQDVQSWRNSHEINVAVGSVAATAAWDEQLFVPAWERSISVELCPR